MTEEESALLMVEDADEVDVVCELCCRLGRLNFVDYKLRLEDTESSFLTCEECHLKLSEK